MLKHNLTIINTGTLYIKALTFYIMHIHILDLIHVCITVCIWSCSGTSTPDVKHISQTDDAQQLDLSLHRQMTDGLL